MRDHDNVEAKQVQDLLSLFFLEGDDGMHLDLYHTSRQDVKNRTKLFLMEKEHFPEWMIGAHLVADGMKKALSAIRTEFRYRKNTTKQERVFDRQKRGKIPEICGSRAEVWPD